MTAKRAQLCLDLGSDINIMRWLKPYARKCIHKENGDKAVIWQEHPRSVAQSCTEAGIGRNMTGLHMILHIVVRVMRYDDLRTDMPDYIRNRIHNSRIMPVDQHIPNVNIENLFCSQNSARGFRFSRADLRKRLRFDDGMALISICHMAHIDLCTLLGVFPQRSAAGNFQIIRMASNSQNVQI